MHAHLKLAKLRGTIFQQLHFYLGGGGGGGGGGEAKSTPNLFLKSVCAGMGFLPLENHVWSTDAMMEGFVSELGLVCGEQKYFANDCAALFQHSKH